MKLNNILLRVCVFVLTASSISAKMPPPKNGLADLGDWNEILVKHIDTLPEGELDGPYEHTAGDNKIIKHTPTIPHDQNLCTSVAIEELKVGEATNYASKVVHPFCLECISYCINGKCGYLIEDVDLSFEQGMATIRETDGT